MNSSDSRTASDGVPAHEVLVLADGLDEPQLAVAHPHEPVAQLAGVAQRGVRARPRPGVMVWIASPIIVTVLGVHAGTGSAVRTLERDRRAGVGGGDQLEPPRVPAGADGSPARATRSAPSRSSTSAGASVRDVVIAQDT